MKVAFLTPLPPVRSGIAQYSAMLLPALSRRLDVHAVVNQPIVDDATVTTIDYSLFLDTRDSYDAVVCQMGNNLHHEFIFDFARGNRSIVVLHDLVLHHLIAERTIARGDADGYIAELRRSEGAAGEAYARGRAAGFHLELGNFLLPAVREIAEGARHVIVHNEFARRLLLESGVSTPVSVIGHPHISTRQSSSFDSKAAAGYAGSDRLIICLGFVTEAKQPAVVLEAFARAAMDDDSLRLVFVGEAAATVNMDALIAASGADRSRVRVAGYVSDDDFDAWIEVADAVVNLRYPTAGESSGPLVRVLAAGKPVAVSDYAQFADLPDDMVTKIPLDAPAAPLAAFMLSRHAVDSTTKREWIAEHSDLEKSASDYADVIMAATERNIVSLPVESALPLFAELSVVSASARTAGNEVHLEVRIRNEGTQIIRARDFGRPVLNILGRAMAGEREVETIWIPLSCDLPPAMEVTLQSTFTAGEVTRIQLFEALTAVPFFPRAPLTVVEVVR